MNTIYKHIYSISFLFCTLFLFTSCVSNDDFDNGVIEGELSQESFVKLQFQLPNYTTQANNAGKTRAMDDDAEKAINPEQLSVLVFSEDGKFLYPAPVNKKSLQFDSSTSNKATVVVQLVKTLNKVNLLVVANQSFDDIELTKNVTTKDHFLKQLTFKMPQQPDGNNCWNASSVDSTPFPMYGESSVHGISEGMSNISVAMFRALARIDVGLNFEVSQNPTNGPYGEEAKGLGNFKLQDIRVYRTYDAGYVSGNVSGTDNIGPKRQDDNPLIYQLDVSSDGKSYVREIYLPEASAPSGSSDPTVLNREIHTIVIGGSFEGGPTTYYKLDFAQDENNQRTYLSILRNYRYVFNVLDVNSPGFSSPDKALEAASTTNVKFEIVSWDETIHEMHVNGKYYFGLDNRELMFESKLESDPSDNYVSLKYQTNYPLSTADPLKFEWEEVGTPGRVPNSSYFDVVWNPANKEIKVKPRADNESNRVYSEILYVKAGPIEIPVKITQDYLDFTYTIDCSKVLVNGTYILGTTLQSDVHYIDLELNASNSKMLGLTYKLHTDPIYGIEFKAEGTFTNRNLNQKVRLVGRGTLVVPAADNYVPFSMIINSNSSSGSFCEATITPILGEINLVSFAKNSRGYNLSGEFPSKNFLYQKRNFGPDDESRVKVKEINAFNGEEDFSNEVVNRWLKGNGNGGKIAEIIHVAYNAEPNREQSRVIKEYLANGGVFLCFMDDASNALDVLKILLNNDNLTGKESGGSDDLYPLLGHSIFRNGMSDENWTNQLNEFREDPVLNGPFGDITEQLWGEDLTSAAGIGGFNRDNLSKITVYSTLQNIDSDGSLVNKSGFASHATAFKYESDDCNIFFIGEGGFTAQKGDNSSRLAQPFLLDGNDAPIAKDPYGRAKLPVYNSAFFGNIMAWAIQRAYSPELMARKAAYKKNYRGR